MGAKVEIIKHNADDFGGIQFEQLSPKEVQQRKCAARWCRWAGQVQVQLPPIDGDIASFRVYCGVHYIRFTIVTALSVGDPSPFAEAERLAEFMGVDWTLVKNVSGKTLAKPENFVCANCTGGMIVETIGMHTGKRYIHTCGS